MTRSIKEVSRVTIMSAAFQRSDRHQPLVNSWNWKALSVMESFFIQLMAPKRPLALAELCSSRSRMSWSVKLTSLFRTPCFFWKRFSQALKVRSKAGCLSSSSQKILLFPCSTLVQMSLLVHLSRLNFHPLHAAHFTGAAFALALMGNLNGGCYALGHHPTGNEEQEPTLRVLWTTGNNDTKSMEKL